MLKLNKCKNFILSAEINVQRIFKQCRNDTNIFTSQEKNVKIFLKTRMTTSVYEKSHNVTNEVLESETTFMNNTQ